MQHIVLLATGQLSPEVCTALQSDSVPVTMRMSDQGVREMRTMQKVGPFVSNQCTISKHEIAVMYIHDTVHMYI